MNQKITKIYSLSTTYPESYSSTKPGFVHTLNKELARLGIQVTVISPHSKNYQQHTMDSVSIHFFKYLPQKYEIHTSIPDEIRTKNGVIKVAIMTIAFFFSTLRLCLKDKDYILHAHWAFPAGIISYLISLILKKKFIVTVHGSEIPLLDKFSFLKKITVRSLNNSSKVITSNNYLKNKLISIGVNKEKISLIKPIPNYVTKPTDQMLLSKLNEKFTIPNEKIILFVGRLTEVKGVKYLIGSMKKIKMNGVHLIIVGDGVLREELKTLATSLAVNDMISFFGPANRHELGWLYSISDVFVLPSITDSLGGSEGTGLVIPEAMNAAIPVIASNVGGISEIIQNEVNGLLVKEKDPESLARAIERLLTNNELREKLVQNSKSILKEFNPKIIASKYFDILKSTNI